MNYLLEFVCCSGLPYRAHGRIILTPSDLPIAGGEMIGYRSNLASRTASLLQMFFFKVIQIQRDLMYFLATTEAIYKEIRDC